MGFLSDFFGIMEGTKEYQVLCPFPHKTSSGQTYLESKPSASVNLEENLFHCMGCDKGLSEIGFIKEIFGCNTAQATEIQYGFNVGNSELDWKKQIDLADKTKELLKELNIPESVAQELQCSSDALCNKVLRFPVIMYGKVLDVRTYNPTQKPKVKSMKNATAGLIIPFDIWKESNPIHTTIICAGEKDMAYCRGLGLNAITFTGGEQTTPALLKVFAGRRVAICYDNDEAGYKGAKKLANALLPYASDVRIVTGFHEVCTEQGEDLWDFFNKYGKTKQDLIEYIKITGTWQPKEEESNIPIKTLFEATKPEYLHKILRANVQVVASSSQTFTIPTTFTAKKTKASGPADTMKVGEQKSWNLDDKSCQGVLHMVDNNFTGDKIHENKKFIAGIPRTEKFVEIRDFDKQTVFKCHVTDMFETTEANAVPMEFTAYSVNERLESGKKYLVTYKLVPHPYKGQEQVMMILKAEQSNDSVSDFKITPEVIQHLKRFRYTPGNVERKIHTFVQKAKGLIGYDGNDDIIRTIDLCYHTPLYFNLGLNKGVRGYLDTIIVGESRVGKSSTADALRKAYGLGAFVSLAGSATTVPGLIGGSNATAGGFQTRAGVLPQNHEGCVIFEEFGKCASDIVSHLTDIRSSNEVRIVRVAGTITLPCVVRMIALTNAKTVGGNIKSISSYPNGIELIKELVPTAEDIARYDIIAIISDRGSLDQEYDWKPEDPFPLEALQARVRWVWSRKADDIVIAEDVYKYIWNHSKALAREFDCHVKIFGTETWKKIARLAIATAAYTVSTDDTWSTIIVTQEHVDYAIKLLRGYYDNETFKLKQYVENEKRYRAWDNKTVMTLQNIYYANTALVLQLEQHSEINKGTLTGGTGMTMDELNKVLQIMNNHCFIRFNNANIIPTERFRGALTQVNRDMGIRALDKLDKQNN